MSHGKQKEWTGGILTDDFAGFGTKVMRKYEEEIFR
jgi:hypothetical protein